ncbi:MAG: HalOD1 output domain-containing protein [Haloferacaceae archaeon]
MEGTDVGWNDDSDGDVTTAEAFQAALRDVMREADENGVDVRGGWSVSWADETTTWDVEITQVARRTTTHERSDGELVSSVVEAVAAREGVDPTDLPPLHDTIDPEILESLQHAADDAGHEVRFRYYDYRVTVDADGNVHLVRE